MASPPDEQGLAGKVAIVTGGGARGDGIGNGRAAAILLARAGAHVLVVDREGKAAERTVAMIEEHDGAAAAALEVDVATDEGCAAMVHTALERWGRLDVLDNNVGIGSRGSVVEETQERWDRVMRINVATMFLASKHAVPAMSSGDDGGAIVNVSSISAL